MKTDNEKAYGNTKVCEHAIVEHLCAICAPKAEPAQPEQPWVGGTHYCERCGEEDYPAIHTCKATQPESAKRPEPPGDAKIIEQIKECYENEGGVAWEPFHSIIAAALAEKDEQIAKLESKARDMESTYQFGAEVMGRLVLPRIPTVGKCRTPIQLLEEWLAERDAALTKLAMAEKERDESNSRFDALRIVYEDFRSAGDIITVELNETQTKLRKAREALAPFTDVYALSKESFDSQDNACRIAKAALEETTK